MDSANTITLADLETETHRMNTTLDTETVWEMLRTIPDPEYGLSIVDMGLIYAAECQDGDIHVTMTLTTPNCPSGEWIYEGVKTALNHLAGAKNVEVEMVFEPPWSPEMLSDDGQRQLGFA